MELFRSVADDILWTTESPFLWRLLMFDNLLSATLDFQSNYFVSTIKFKQRYSISITRNEFTVVYDLTGNCCE